MNYFQISQRESYLLTCRTNSAVFGLKQPLNSSPSTYIPSKFTIVTHYESTGISQHKHLVTGFPKSPTSPSPFLVFLSLRVFATFKEMSNYTQEMLPGLFGWFVVSRETRAPLIKGAQVLHLLMKRGHLP